VREDQAGPDSRAKLGIFRKRKKKISPIDAEGSDSQNRVPKRTMSSVKDDQAAEKILDVTKALEAMRALGLELSGLKEFTTSLHKLAVASGVAPGVLTSIIKEVNTLCAGKRISIAQAQKHIQELGNRKNALLKEFDDLERKKQSLQIDLSLKELEYSTSTQTLAEYLSTKKQLEQHKLSFNDISKLVTMINNAANQDYDSSSIVQTLAEMQSEHNKLEAIETEIESLLDSKRTLQGKLLTLEQEIANRQKLIASAEQLSKLGFDFQELDKLHSAIKMIAETRNIELVSARNQLLSDLEGYYANEHELRKRIRILESLLQEKEEKFKMLEGDYQNEKAILDNAKKLISDGFDRQWIEKLQVVIDAYGIDLDLLSEELKQKQGLKSSIDELERMKMALEEEERLMRQKVVAVEDQRIKTLSLIQEMIKGKTKSSRMSPTSNPTQTQPSPDDSEITMIAGELGELIRAAQGNDINEGKFKVSAKKAIEIICSRLEKNSPARVVLEHALIALRYEEERKKQSTS
jgi:hypothetical protein